MNSQHQELIEIREESLKEPFAQIPLFILANPTISSNAKVVYGLLISYAWRKNYCFPGQARLGADMGRDVTNVRKYLKELKTHGLVSYDKQGFAGTNLYIIHEIPQAIKDSYNKRGQQLPTRPKKVRQPELQKPTEDVEESKSYEDMGEDEEVEPQPPFNYKYFYQSLVDSGVALGHTIMKKQQEEAAKRLYNTIGCDLLNFYASNLLDINSVVPLDKHKSYSFTDLERNIPYYEGEIVKAGSEKKGPFTAYGDYFPNELSKATNTRYYRRVTNNGTSPDAAETLEKCKKRFNIEFPTFYDDLMNKDGRGMMSHVDWEALKEHVSNQDTLS